MVRPLREKLRRFPEKSKTELARSSNSMAGRTPQSREGRVFSRYLHTCVDGGRLTSSMDEMHEQWRSIQP